jgi:predicted histone-like DNA-binding protein
MSILYKVVARVNPQDRSAAPKYYAEAVSRGSISTEDFLDDVCADTTLNRDEVRMSFNKGFRTILQYAEKGISVHLDSLGYIKISTKSEGKDTEEEVTADSIIDIIPHFVFSKDFRSALKKVRREKVK